MRSLFPNMATLAIIAVLAGANGVQAGLGHNVGTQGSNDCPSGHEKITSEADCQHAQSDFFEMSIGATTWGGDAEEENLPGGCYVLNAKVYFNVYENGAQQSVDLAYPLCVESIGAGGDPMTKGKNGEPVRFYISSTAATSLIQQPPGIDVVVVGGPATNQGAVKRGDWMTEVSLRVGGEPLLKATVRSGLAAGAKSLQGRYPLGGELPASLTSLNLTTFPEGKVIQDVGSFGLQAKGSALPASVTVSQVSSKPIGKAYVETATIKIGGTFELMLFTAKANKFESEREQIAYTHLDFKMIKYDRETVTGPLPEMWGLQPMSGATKAMLSPPHAAA